MEHGWFHLQQNDYDSFLDFAVRTPKGQDCNWQTDEIQRSKLTKVKGKSFHKFSSPAQANPACVCSSFIEINGYLNEV